MRVAVRTGDECPGGSAVFQRTCLSGPKSVGTPVASEMPSPLGPRKRDHGSLRAPTTADASATRMTMEATLRRDIGRSLAQGRQDPIELRQVVRERLLAGPGQAELGPDGPVLDLPGRGDVAGLFQLVQAVVQVAVGRAQAVAQFREGPVLGNRQSGHDPEPQRAVDDLVEGEGGAGWRRLPRHRSPLYYVESAGSSDRRASFRGSPVQGA